MSTRGFISFAVDGETKTAYNHHDSYPDWLGVRMLEFARGIEDFDAVKVQAQALRVITDEDPEPDDGYIEALREFADLTVDTHTHDPATNEYRPRVRPSWYQLLRGTQGNPSAMLRAGVIQDGSDFPADSLFAEYGYVVDFDKQVLEAYVGFQRAPHSKGRFASAEANEGGYYPVALAASWPLSDLPESDAFVAAIDGEDDDA